jgi:uncharacterized protein YndB with AHSA1/START domain
MYGTLEQLDDGRWQLRFTRTLPHPLEKVWRAITEPEHLAHWFPSTIEGERTAGAHLRFSFPQDLVTPIDGEMLAYQPPSLLEFRWGADILRLELREAGDGTVLTLLDTLDERGKAARDGVGTSAWTDSQPTSGVSQPPASQWASGRTCSPTTSRASAPKQPRSGHPKECNNRNWRASRERSPCRVRRCVIDQASVSA